MALQCRLAEKQAEHSLLAQQVAQVLPILTRPTGRPFKMLHKDMFRVCLIFIARLAAHYLRLAPRDISISLELFHCAPCVSWGAVATFDGIFVIRSQMNSELAERKDQLQQLCCQVLTGLRTCHTNL